VPHVGKRGMNKLFWWGNLNERDLFEDGMSIKMDLKEWGRA